MSSKVNYIEINGEVPTNTKVTKLTSTFMLQQTFCSCPNPVSAVKIVPGWCDRCWLPVVCHYDHCSGGEGKNKIGTYDRENNEVILEGGCRVPFH